MKRRTVLLALGAAAAFVLAFPVSAAPAAPPSGFSLHQLLPTDRHALLPTHDATVDAVNWAGYADLPTAGHKVTSVATAFTVPAATILPPGFSATWAGVGGYSTSDLIQAGVAEDSFPSDPLLGDQYYAWYEVLPAGNVQLTDCFGDPACTVTPGDRVTVSIVEGSGTNWTISMSDAGHWSWSTQLSYASSNSSAEWIQEAPQLDGLQTPIADDGTVTLGPGNTYAIDGGTPADVAAGAPVQIVLSPAGALINEATPSSLGADGDSFNVCSYSQTCTAP
jgi:hypothetical protein